MNLKTAILSVLALAAGVAEPALSQSTAVPQVKASRLLSDPLRLLRLPSTRTAPAAAVKKAVPDAVALGLATAKVYRFASADFPGTSTSIVFDENKSTVVGYFQYTGSSSLSPFTLKGGVYKSFVVPGALSGAVTGINTGGDSVGIYADIGGVEHGFLDKAGVFTTIDKAGGTAVPYDINDTGEIVGIDEAATDHGFYSNDGGASFTDFDVPGATSTLAAGVNSAGAIVGEYTDAAGNTHGFLLSGGVYTPIDFPLATDTGAIGINDSNEVAGFFTDAAGTTHGFLYSDGAYTLVDVAGAASTELTRIKNNGHVTGLYVDSLGEEHGLTGQ